MSEEQIAALAAKYANEYLRPLVEHDPLKTVIANAIREALAGHDPRETPPPPEPEGGE